jgi:iron complex outermembrane recepter protein
MERANTRFRRNLSRSIALVLGATAGGMALSQTTSFDVPEQPAVSAIPEFARQAHLQIIAPADKLAGIKTHAVRGVMDIHAALKQLLDGTGLVIASDDGHTISLRSIDAPQPRSTAPDPASAGNQLEEIMVTAQRRTESAQQVPITLQVLTGEAISQLNVATFDDFMKYLPNVTSDGYGPGQGDIYMRGLSFTQGGNGGGAAPTIFPNVAIYLDEQSGQLPGRNLDVYAVDLERIEVLEGPQGTLFGAGAQAGVLRYITNKPKLDATEGSVDAGYAITAGGDPSTNVDATINLPVIADTLAVRAVIYDESRGGYINNIPGTFARAPTDDVVVNYFGGAVPKNSGPISNNSLVADAINPVVYKGLRVSGFWKISDEWNALLMQSYQDMDAGGVSWEEQYDGLGRPLPPLSVQLYNPSYDKDKFEDTQLTINGRIGPLKLVYAGSYLDRNVTQQADYTNYSRGQYASYYQCDYPGYPFVGGKPTAGSAGYCYSPSAFFTEKENSTHQSHEIRASTPDDGRLRALGGLFWENFTIHDQSDWHYGTSPNFVPVAPPSGATANNPNVRPAGDVYFDDTTIGYTQKAVFGSVDYDLIPKALTLTLGTRYYRMKTFEVGSTVGSFGCEIYGPNDGGVPASPCTLPEANGYNLNANNPAETYTGFKSRANVSWHVTPEDLVYYTWSQGFRPGGFNRAQSIISPGSPLYGLYTPPLTYGPDLLINNEIGWKTEWLDHRLQWNGAIYQEDWKNVQIGILDPGITGNLEFIANGPNYRVRGAETSVLARIVAGLTVTASASENHSEVVKTLSLVDPKTGQPIDIVNPFGAAGSPLAVSPPFQGNIRIRYEFPIDEYQAFWQVAATHQSGSIANTDPLSTTLQGVSVDFHDPGFSTYDAAIGIGKDAWAMQLYGVNISNTQGVPFSSYSEYVKMNTIIRPRTLGLRFSYKFQDH